MAKRMPDDNGFREEAVPPAVIRMVVCVDDVSYRHHQFIRNIIAQLLCFLGNKGIDQHGPLRSDDRAGCYLSIEVTLEPVDVFGDTFMLHKKEISYRLCNSPDRILYLKFKSQNLG